MVEILTPRDSGELAEVIAAAAAEHRPLRIEGSGSRAGLGQPGPGQVVRLSALAGISDYQPEELVMTLAAGTPMAAVRAALDQAGQHLAFEVPDWGPLWGQAAGGGTIGGLLASGLAGSRRISAGGARDHFLGFTAINGQGQSFKAGGQVVKNVTGYDLPKLLAGSYGTLAALTDVTVKTLPRPETSCSLLVATDDPVVGLAAVTHAMGSPHEVSGAAYLPAAVAADMSLETAAQAVIRLEGFDGSVAARAAALREDLGRLGPVALLADQSSRTLWQSLSDATPLAARPELTVWRLSVAPGDGPGVLAAVGPHALAWFDWAGGLIWLGLAPGEADGGAGRVRAALAGRGHATLIRAPEALRRSIAVFEPQPGLAGLAARVKASFDPAGILNPGRMG